MRLDLKAYAAVKMRLRRLTRRNWRVLMPVRIAALNRFTRGWTAYFALAHTPSVFQGLDEWLRGRLRQVRWEEWKRWRCRARNLCVLLLDDARDLDGAGGDHLDVCSTL
ncbi:MAG: hypothetical protein M5U22_16735 [Thermoleophilia bacterium]|nr:hypothetical protein [Thermoleophilia bacterium]